MPGSWGPPPMMYPPCPPWAGWYGPWTSPSMHFHPKWSGLAEDFGHGGYYIRDGRYGSIGHQQDRRTPTQENQMVQNLEPNSRFPRRQQHLLVSSTNSGCPRMNLLLMDQGAARVKQGRGVKLRPMMKQRKT
jgi:hypothetical protein